VKEIVCWYVTPCNLVSVCQRPEDYAVSVFRVENGESRFLQNVEKFYPDYTVSHYVRYLSLLMHGLLIMSEKLIHLVKNYILNYLEHGSPTRGLPGCILRPAFTFVN